jgi:hypothetical protein
MRIIITETQKELLDYNRLSYCIKRRMDLPMIDETVISIMDELIISRLSLSLSDTLYLVIDTIYSNISDDVEVCWGDETYYQFSTSIKRFLTSRYEDTITKYYKSYYV